MQSLSKVASLQSKIGQIFLHRGFIGSSKSPARGSNALLRVTSGRFRPEIDGLRFFAIIPVVLSHLFEWVFRRQNERGLMGSLESSNYHYFVNHLPGVLLFFAISGYILTYQITNASVGGYNWSKYGQYVVRRFKRIAPPYYIVLIATFFVVGVIGFMPKDTRHFAENHTPLVPSLIASLFYCHWLVFEEWPKLLGGGWTLEIETQYYLMAPILTLIYLSLNNKGLRIWAGIATIFLTSIVASQYGVGSFWAGTIVKFFPYFFTGMLALELQRHVQGIVRIVPKVILDFFTVAAVCFYLTLDAPDSGDGLKMFEFYVANIMCVMTMFIAVSIEDNVLRRVCINRHVVIIGGACYSIYLTHGQTIFVLQNLVYRYVVFPETYLAMIFNVAIEIPVVIAVGLTFYRLIEKPFMMWGASRRPSSSPAKSAA
jgi:peptidoglycan/LPS O-acetylase OafA/YrhL